MRAKLAWLRENDPRSWAGVESGQVAVGTVDSYLVARMTSGAAHVTDASNASRTLLYDVQRGGWSAELCELLGTPLGALPEIVPNWGEFTRTDPAAFLGIDAPISGMAGDQQAALFGQACFGVGEAKCTYGTGSFILVNTGKTLQRSDAGLLSTVAWQGPEGPLMGSGTSLRTRPRRARGRRPGIPAVAQGGRTQQGVAAAARWVTL